ncbi:hypothetical protein QE385_003980 [Sphingomonas sp. SORGH_AS 950]|uniref:HsdM family class I SAM-dependent methyltransferase n=1 Tax=Sphingomonas sp. SORGH_AS_0950 TaxID=3041792 RepID=UPI0027842EA6|nr:N-6 DNA methylase [Sphingomonas sp. SORGH_AS_0950]MDQ1159583.1 hypothetical protein [Sphingomonas sp. SORGH_AS_0950]
MTSVPGFWDLMERAGFTRGGGPTDGMITFKPQQPRDTGIGRYAFLFDRTRFPLAIEGVFKSGTAPVLMFVDASGAGLDDEAAVDCHRLAWNVGLAPLLWVSLPDRVLILDSYRRPSGRLADVQLAEFSLAHRSGVEQLVTTCGRLAFDTGAFWASDFARRIDRHHRVDAVLLRELTAVELTLTRGGLTALMAQKLIGRTIFSQYLIDRGVLGVDLLRRLFGYERLSDTLRSTDTAPRLFEWLRMTFNGDLFPPNVVDERSLIKSQHLATLADFLDGHEAATGQMSAFPFRFDFIPVELVSSIYEQFAHTVAGTSAAMQGLHYTPVNLVDLTLDQVMEGVTGHAKVLDPACGSGVFLVEAMRRLVWLRTRNEPNTRELVRDVLRNQIFGVDINAGALQVAAFSLYLAALELDPDLDSCDLEWLKFDHLIGRNLLQTSFFDASFDGRTFDVVVGNPPWTYGGAASDDGAKPGQAKVVQPRRSPDWAFLWQARRHAASGARMALLMKATPFFSKDRLAGEARRLLFSTFRDAKLVNFSQMRGEGLFPSLIGRPGSRKPNAGPALLFCGTLGAPTEGAVLETANVRWNPNFRRNGVLDLSSDDFHNSPLPAVVGDPVLLKAAVFGNAREYQVVETIQGSPALTRLGAWCHTNGLRMEQGLQVGGGSKGNTASLTGLPFLDPAGYRPLRINTRRLPRFKLEHAHRPRERAAYCAPLVLCPEAGFAGALQRGRYSAAVVSEDTIFTDSFVGISFAGHDPQLADALSIVLNSRTVAFLLTMGGSNTGLKQPKIEKIDLEMLAFPDLSILSPRERNRLSRLHQALGERSATAALDMADEIVMELYNLDGHDRPIVQDALARTRPILLDSREERQKEVDKITPRLLHDYGCEVAHWLDTVLRIASSARAVATRAVRVSADMVALKFEVQEGPPRPTEGLSIQDPDLFEIGIFSDEMERLPRFRTGRSVRVYAGTAVYVVKPDERRNWTSSTAQVDFLCILDDIRSNRVRIPGISGAPPSRTHKDALVLN